MSVKFNNLGVKICVTIFCFILPILVSAKPIEAKTATLTLNYIKQIKPQESHDEIYFLITDLGAKKKFLYTIPGYANYIQVNRAPHPVGRRPVHFWRDANLNKIKNVLIWSRSNIGNKNTQLSISLVEADMPPWDIDDVLGTIKVNIIKKNNQVDCQLKTYANTRIIKRSITPYGSQYTLLFKNDGAEYQASLEFTDTKE